MRETVREGGISLVITNPRFVSSVSLPLFPLVEEVVLMIDEVEMIFARSEMISND